MRPQLVAALVVRNEADRYLRMVLADLETYCDAICVLDDGSTDATPDICTEHRSVRLHRNAVSTFWQNEAALRRQLWNLALGLNPEWILAIDADEMVEDRFKREKTRYLNQTSYPIIAVHVHELWSSMDHYRVDKLWNPVGKKTPMFVRYTPGYPYRWLDQPLHCGRIPWNAAGPPLDDGLRAKHLGYANPSDHRRKYEAYLRHDPMGNYCPLSHYQSILDRDVRLELWRD